MNKVKLSQALDTTISVLLTIYLTSYSLMNAEQIKSIFAQMDVNGDGTLSFEEIAQGLTKVGIKADISKLKASFEAVDVDKNGTLDPEEFVSLMAKI
ncbi:Conserved_hypothetical protein [Hexamita inflata]|uniref:EF-hand domain-containing protein n=1 Tax=Hexamita inflata TaxID=28002 RepID=A0AA86Q508_9EUKA|nr:Conserved hypothetical protein [Hexamita inflata]CAI9952440.1 Conserved hypothetical protein [Hexamita inflata]